MKENNMINQKGICEEIYLLKVSQAKRILDNLSKIGIDISTYSSVLENIVDDVENKTKNYLYSDKTGVAIYESRNEVYKKYNDELDKLINDLKKYDGLFASYYKTQSIERELSKNNKEILSNLNEMVDLIITALNDVNSLNLPEYGEAKFIYDKIYEIAYDLMKLEFKYFSKSKIFEYSKNNDIVRQSMNNLISNDLEKYNKDDIINNCIKIIIDKIKSKGVDFDYLNEALLVYLSINVEDLSILQKKLKELNNSISDSKKSIEFYKNEIDLKKQNVSLAGKDAFKNSIKPFIFVLIAIFGIKHTSKLSKSLCTDYKATIETYSSISGEKKKTELYQASKEDEIKYTHYSPREKLYNGNYKRIVEEYDLSDFNEREDIMEYLNINFNHFSPESTLIKLTYPGEENNDIEGEYYELYSKKIDKDDFIFYKTSYYIGNTIIFLVELLFLALLDEKFSYEMGIKDIKESFEDFIGNIKGIKKYKIEKEDLEKLLDAEIKLLESNQELKEEFIKKYNLLFQEDNGLKLNKEL